jgi:hypothetical protein
MHKSSYHRKKQWFYIRIQALPKTSAPGNRTEKGLKFKVPFSHGKDLPGPSAALDSPAFTQPAPGK